jgi:hypothetical protein
MNSLIFKIDTPFRKINVLFGGANASRVGTNASRVDTNASRVGTNASRGEAIASRVLANASRVGTNASRVGTNAPYRVVCLDYFFVFSPQGEMCITGGEAKRNRRITSLINKSPAGTRLWLCWLVISPRAGLREVCEIPIRRLRFAPPTVMHINPLRGLADSGE